MSSLAAAAGRDVVRLLELVLLDLLAERVAVDPQVLGRAREVAAVALEDPSDEALLEFPPRVVEEDAPIDHLGHQRIELLLHGIKLPVIDRPARPGAAGPVLRNAP